MANTVSVLSYANTFGDWLTTTIGLARENNTLAANAYTKSTGTLFLSDPSLGLQVANNAIIGGTLQSTGTGSSAYVQNSLTVGQTGTFSNVISGNVSITYNLTVGGVAFNPSTYNAVNNTQNTWITNTDSVAQGAYSTANGAVTFNQGVNTTQNTRISSADALATNAYIRANGAFAQGNTALDYAASAFNKANTAVTSVTGTTNQINVSGTTSVTLSTPQSINTTASVQFGSFGVGTTASGTTGEIRATNNITAYYSDDRLKTRLGKIENALDKIMALNGFYHEANETAQALGYEPIREVGVSAQEVESVMPEVVAPAPIDPQYLTVRYERLVPLLIEGIKELKQAIDELKLK